MMQLDEANLPRSRAGYQRLRDSLSFLYIETRPRARGYQSPPRRSKGRTPPRPMYAGYQRIIDGNIPRLNSPRAGYLTTDSETGRITLLPPPCAWGIFASAPSPRGLCAPPPRAAGYHRAEQVMALARAAPSPRARGINEQPYVQVTSISTPVPTRAGYQRAAR